MYVLSSTFNDNVYVILNIILYGFIFKAGEPGAFTNNAPGYVQQPPPPPPPTVNVDTLANQQQQLQEQIHQSEQNLAAQQQVSVF